MSERTFAAWVEPIAATLRDNREQVLAFARARPDDAWARPSGAEGWTCKDILAHLAGGNDRLFQAVLRRVIAREAIEASLLSPDTDGENARGVEQRRTKTAGELIDDLQADGEEVQHLLSQLQDGDEDMRQERPPFILKGFVEFVGKEHHDLEHLAQLRAALEVTA